MKNMEFFIEFDESDGLFVIDKERIDFNQELQEALALKLGQGDI